MGINGVDFLDVGQIHQLIEPLGLRVGGWGSISDIGVAPRFAHIVPPKEALSLAYLSAALAKWIDSQGWLLVHFDNSTSPSHEEAEVLSVLLLNNSSQWSGLARRSILLHADSSDAAILRRRTKIELFINYSIIIQWHVYLVPAGSRGGKRLSLLDGAVYCYGDEYLGLDNWIDQNGSHCREPERNPNKSPKL